MSDFFVYTGTPGIPDVSTVIEVIINYFQPCAYIHKVLCWNFMFSHSMLEADEVGKEDCWRNRLWSVRHLHLQKDELYAS